MKLHHSLLHDGLIRDNSEVIRPTVVASTRCDWNVFLGVIPVKIQSMHGFQITYALLDPASQITLVRAVWLEGLISEAEKSIKY